MEQDRVLTPRSSDTGVLVRGLRRGGGLARWD